MTVFCARPRPRAVSFALAFFILASACDDPTSVGLELVDGQGEPPSSTRLSPPPTSLDVRDITGGAERVLAGAVSDPLLGRIEATALVDFGTAPAANAAFRAAQVDALVLRFTPDYLHGDTTDVTRLALYASPENYGLTTNFRADTTLPVGTFIQTLEFDPNAERVEVTLAAQYLSSVQDALRSEDFVDDFPGLFIGPAQDGSSDVVVGLSVSDFELRAVQGTDSVTFPALRLATASLLQRTDAAVVPSDRLLLQDGTGPGIRFQPDFSDLTNTIVHGARLELTVDTTAVNAVPAGFVRPRLSRLSLFAVQSDGSDIFLEQSTFTGESIVFRGNTLRSYVQSIALGTISVDRFELRFDTFFSSLNGLNAALLKLDEGIDLDVVATKREGSE